MTTNKQLRWFNFELIPDLGFVTPRITANMGHQYFHFFAEKSLRFWKHTAHNMVVDVAINGFQGFEGREPVGSFRVANVSGVPDFVNRFEEAKNTWAYCAVRVRKQSNSSHKGKNRNGFEDLLI